MKNPFLDLFLQKPEQKDYIENLPQDSDINNVQNMTNVQQPSLPIAEDLPEINQNTELPETDEDVKSNGPINKIQDFKSLLEEYRANREGRAKAIEAASEQDRRTRLLNNLSKAMAQLNTGLASGYANIKVDPIDLGPADAEAKARAAQQGKLGELMTEYKLKKAMEPKKVSEKEKIDLETAKEKLKQLKQKPIKKEEEKPLTKGQEALDREFAKEYSDYIAAGGYASVQKNLQDLDTVVKRLEEKDDVTGTLREKLIPSDYVRSIVNEEAQDLKDTVERVIQQSLRQTLGAQFTEKEATRLIERSYNPRLSDEKNIERLKQTIKEIQNMAEAKQKSAKYFEEKGTLSGYRGNVDIKKSPKIKVNIPGRGQGTIDSDKLEDFLKAYPNAEVME